MKDVRDWGVFQLHVGDCLETMRRMPDASVDSVVCDPPYGLSFMGKKWDVDVPGVETWAEALRVLKPGGYLLAFAGTRTYHRMAVAIEDAGFEIRDQIGWVYGSGFPKSHNGDWGGTALKPAWEPIVLARKPLIGTVEANWQEHGTGGLNIDGCRVGDDVRPVMVRTGTTVAAKSMSGVSTGATSSGEVTTLGRWPANLIHDGSDEVLAAFPQAPGQLADVSTNSDARKTQNVYGSMRRGRGDEPSADSANEGAVGFKMRPGARRLDEGSAARFFYCAKASKADRNGGLEGFTARNEPAHRRTNLSETADNPYLRGVTERLNTHPTVKPTDLMRYLCRLVTPRGGLILDPFAGSGSTGKAAVKEGFRFIGCELSKDYADLAERRIAHAIFGDLA